jgi:hypothetical protein
MTICELCQSIPFHDLPTLPDNHYSFGSGWEYLMIGLERTQKPTSRTAGFNYWPNVEGLRSSSAQCDLCNLIYTSVEKVATTWDNVTEEKLDNCSVRPPRPTFEMQIRKRTIGDGFWVITKTENPFTLQIVAAVGFCVEEGISSLIPFLQRYTLC